MRRKLIPTAIAFALAVTMAACSSGGGDDGSSGTTTTSEETTTTTESTTSTTSGDSGTTTTSGGSSGTTATTAPRTTTTARTACAEVQSWGTGARQSSTMAQEEFYNVRVGRHDCYDRVVFDINGVVPGTPVAGYHVSYVNGEVTADGSGQPVPTEGNAALQVVVRAPILGSVSGNTQAPPRVGHDYYSTRQLRSWASLKEVTYAGSFEGQTTIAVGVPSMRPFRVGAFERDGYTHVYVDVAH
jgi:hypothetical protein